MSASNPKLDFVSYLGTDITPIETKHTQKKSLLRSDSQAPRNLGCILLNQIWTIADHLEVYMSTFAQNQRCNVRSDFVVLR